MKEEIKQNSCQSGQSASFEQEANLPACQSGRVNSFTQLAQMEKNPSKPIFGGEDVRVINAMIDIIYPEIRLPSNKIINALGEAKIREMVWHQHRLLLKTKVGDLFPKNEEALKMAIEKSADFFVEALGGNPVFTEQHGEPQLRMRHFKIPIDENDREIWLAMYKKTLKEIDFPKELLEEFWNWIEPLSIRMINRRTTMEPIKRHHWSDVKKELMKSGAFHE